jgi:hypothetical protein
MRLVRRFVLLLALVLAVLPVTATRAEYRSPGYIQINNGAIVTNRGQHPQVVVQFGNRGSAPIAGYVACFLSSGSIGRISKPVAGPFPHALIGPDRTYVMFYQTRIGPATYGINVAPGQNYNVAFRLKIKAPAGTSGSLLCRFHGGYKGPLWDEVTVPIIVQ